MKKVIVISTSLRVGSNSDMLADKFTEGALHAGHDVEKISLAGKNISFCRGCLACQKLGRCVIDDDANGIMQKVLNADVVVWATPIYYYEMSGQMKVMIDRMNAMYPLDYKFRDVYLLTTAAENEPEVPKRAESGLTGWTDCYPKADLPAHYSAAASTLPTPLKATKSSRQPTKWDCTYSPFYSSALKRQQKPWKMPSCFKRHFPWLENE